jgi:hypothetical protein
MRTVLLLVLVFPSLAAAQPRDVAELFPPSTVAYAELRDPAAVADALAAVFKGSPFEDGLKLLHDRKDAAKDPRFAGGSGALAGATLLASPEFLAEFRRIRGAAIGFFGLTANHEPKIAGCVLTGESVAAALYARAYLTNEALFRRVAVVDGVAILQSRAAPVPAYDPNTGKPIPFEPKPATEGPCEPTYAYVPGLFIVASNKDAIAEVLARYKGTAKDSLAASPDFSVKRPAGINAFVRTIDFVRTADAAKKARKDLLPPESLAHLKLVLNPRSMPLVTAHGSLGSTGMRWTIEFPRDPKQPSPLLDLLANPVPAEALRTIPPGAAAGLSVGLPAKDRRAADLLAFADAILKAEGNVGRSATEWVEEYETKSKLPIRARLLSEIRGLSVVFLPKPELPPHVEPWPLLALHLESNASDWETAIPKLAAAFDGLETPAQPSSETIRDVKVRTLSVAGTPLHYARRDSTWVFGLDRKQVAECCSANESAPASADVAFVTARWPGLVKYDSLRKFAGQFEQRSRVQHQFEFPFGGGFLPPGLLDPQSGGELSADDFKNLFGSLPPLALRGSRAADRIAFDLRWDFDREGSRGFLAKLLPILERIGTGPAVDGLRFSPFDR